jgi:chromate transporter
MATWLALYRAFLGLGLISFGGVFAILPDMQRLVVDQHGWLTRDEFVQAFAVGQVVPGPNMAMCALIGWKVAGLPGAVAAFLGIYTGPVAVMGVAYATYHRARNVDWVRRIELAFRPVVLGLLAASGLGLLRVAAGGHWAVAALTVAVALFVSVKLRWSALTTLGVGAVVWFAGERLLGGLG